MVRDCDVVVVGGGLSGLMAARCLARAGKDVRVVEAQAQVGGRVQNVTLPRGEVLDMGGQWLGPSQARMYRLCKELGLKTYPSYCDGQHVVHFGGRVYRVTAKHGAAPVLSRAAAHEVEGVTRKLDEMVSQVDPCAPYDHPSAPAWDQQTFDSWLQQNASEPLALAYFRTEITGLFAAEASEFSLLHALFYLRSGGGFGNLVSVGSGAQQDRIFGGAQGVARKMAEALGDRVHLSAPVHRVEQHAGGVQVVTQNQTVRAARAIIALPPAAASRLVYDSPLSPAKAQLLKRQPMGAVIKVMLLYKTPFWRAAGLSGQVFSDAGAVRMTFDNSAPGSGSGVLMGFVEGREARRASRLDKESREAEVVSCLVRYFGPEAGAHLGYHEKDWLKDPWAQGGYGAYLEPGAWTEHGGALRRPCGRVHWAGTETSSVWNGYMEGAVRSGERAAQEVIDAEKALSSHLPKNCFKTSSTTLPNYEPVAM